jgi:hypothetical protein
MCDECGCPEIRMFRLHKTDFNMHLRNIWNCWTGYTCITWFESVYAFHKPLRGRGLLPRRNTSTEHQKLWSRHLHLKIKILTKILSRVNQTGTTRHCFVYISNQDGDIKCPKNCSDTSNPKQYFKAHCSLRQHWRIPFHSNNIWIIPM